MAGKTQFNKDAVLEAAMQVFWKLGLERASLSELEKATGLNKSSLYNSFGDKQELYRQCLDRFYHRYENKLVEHLDNPDFHDGIKRFFDALVIRQRGQEVPSGCLATFSALEREECEQETAQMMERELEGLHATFQKRCQRAVKEGQLPLDADCNAIAAMLLALSRGVAILGRGHSDVGFARNAVRGLLQSL